MLCDITYVVICNIHIYVIYICSPGVGVCVEVTLAYGMKELVALYVTLSPGFSK